MSRKRAALSNLEWEVMSVIWEIGGTPSVRNVLERGYPDREKAYTTVQTVMNNLVNKGFLTKKKTGLVNFYRPVKKKSEVLKKETNFFVEKVFGGSALEMANYLLDTSRLSRDQLERLKRVIDEKEKNLKGGRS